MDVIVGDRNRDAKDQDLLKFLLFTRMPAACMSALECIHGENATNSRNGTHINSANAE